MDTSTTEKLAESTSGSQGELVTWMQCCEDGYWRSFR
jgi:hypothetical protein